MGAPSDPPPKFVIDKLKEALDENGIHSYSIPKGEAYFLEAVAKYMKKGSSIINISSNSGTKATSPECLDYNVSKVGIRSLTRDLAYQFKPNIRVNTVAAGWTDTDMNKNLPEDYLEAEKGKIYLDKFAKPSDVAKAIYFLSTDNASHINGEILTVDGGYQ